MYKIQGGQTPGKLEKWGNLKVVLSVLSVMCLWCYHVTRLTQNREAAERESFVQAYSCHTYDAHIHIAVKMTFVNVPVILRGS